MTDHPDWTARFELIGDLYYRETGRLRPGKDEAPAMNRDSSDPENRARFDEWAATKMFNALLDHAIAIEVAAQGELVVKLTCPHCEKAQAVVAAQAGHIARLEAVMEVADELRPLAEVLIKRQEISTRPLAMYDVCRAAVGELDAKSTETSP